MLLGVRRVCELRDAHDGAPWQLRVTRVDDMAVGAESRLVVARQPAEWPVVIDERPEHEIGERAPARRRRRRELRALGGAGDVEAVAERQRVRGVGHGVVSVQDVLGEVRVAAEVLRAACATRACGAATFNLLLTHVSVV